jgi:hypothetical protein
MLLEIWFPQIVIVVGSVGAILCFAAMLAPTDHHEDDGHTDHSSH